MLSASFPLAEKCKPLRITQLQNGLDELGVDVADFPRFAVWIRNGGLRTQVAANRPFKRSRPIRDLLLQSLHRYYESVSPSAPLRELGPLTFEQVRRTPQEALFNSLMEQYHYLGYEQPVGEHLKYVVSANR